MLKGRSLFIPPILLFLPDIPIPDQICITSDLGEAVKGKDMIVLAVPSQYMRGVLGKLKAYKFSGEIFVSVTKGIENGTLKRMSEVVYDILGQRPLAVLSGPTIALEVANGVPTTAGVASESYMPNWARRPCRTTEEIFSRGRKAFTTFRDWKPTWRRCGSSGTRHPGRCPSLRFRKTNARDNWPLWEGC